MDQQLHKASEKIELSLQENDWNVIHEPLNFLISQCSNKEIKTTKNGDHLFNDITTCLPLYLQAFQTNFDEIFNNLDENSFIVQSLIKLSNILIENCVSFYDKKDSTLLNFLLEMLQKWIKSTKQIFSFAQLTHSFFTQIIQKIQSFTKEQKKILLDLSSTLLINHGFNEQLQNLDVLCLQIMSHSCVNADDEDNTNCIEKYMIYLNNLITNEQFSSLFDNYQESNKYLTTLNLMQVKKNINLDEIEKLNKSNDNSNQFDKIKQAALQFTQNISRWSLFIKDFLKQISKYSSKEDETLTRQFNDLIAISSIFMGTNCSELEDFLSLVDFYLTNPSYIPIVDYFFFRISLTNGSGILMILQELVNLNMIIEHSCLLSLLMKYENAKDIMNSSIPAELYKKQFQTKETEIDGFDNFMNEIT